MNTDDTASLGDDSFAGHDRIDQACDRFEAAWKRGERPRIEDELARCLTASERATLLRELLILELFWRKRGGEQPEPREYVERFADKDDIAEIVAAFARAAAAPPRFTNHEFHERGGLGAVYTAHDEELNRIVAVKRIRDDRAVDPQSQARFLREAEITGRLEHPGIVAVYSLNHGEDGRPYYAMRLIRGETLKDAIARFHSAGAGTPDPGERSLALRGLLRRLIDVCNAVAYAHSRGVLHRDLKPENIMLGPFGETLVLDWGLAKPLGSSAEPDAPEPPIEPAASSGSSDTQPGSRVGTPRYMSPEQAGDQAGAVGPASDVYSLGAILYHVLAGGPPFEGERDMAAVLEKVQAGAFAPPRTLRPDVPRALEAACMKAMSLRPEDRYQSARALADDLEHWLADEPVTAWREPLRVRARRWMRRHRTLVTAVAATLIVGLVALGVGYWRVSIANKTLAERNQQLREARNESDANFEMAQLAVDDYTTKISENALLKIQDSHDVRQLRKELLEQALSYYQKFIEKHQNDPKLRGKLAEAYRRVAMLTEEIGSKEAALARFEQCLDIVLRLNEERPDLLSDQSMLPNLYNRIGNLQSELGRNDQAIRSYERGREIALKRIGEGPNDARSQQVLSSIHHNLGRLLCGSGRIQEGLEALDQAVKILDGPETEGTANLGTRRLLAQALQARAVILSRQSGHTAEALSSYERSRDILEKLGSANLANSEIQGTLAVILNNGGELYQAAGQPKQAIQFVERARDIRKRLAAKNPSVTQFQFDLAFTLLNLGAVEMKASGSDKAIRTYQEALRILTKLVLENPSAVSYKDSRARCLQLFAVVQIAAGRTKEALLSLERAREIRDELAKDNPSDTSFQRELARTYLQLGSAQNQLLRFDEGLRSYEQARRILATLCENSPNNSQFLSDLAVLHSTKGELLNRLGRMDDSVLSLRESLKIAEKLVKDNRSNPLFRMNLATGHFQVGVVQLGSLGRRDQAARSFEAARATLQELVDAQPSNAIFLGQLARCHQLIAIQQDLDGQTEDAMHSHERRLAVFVKLVKLDPSSASCKSGLAQSYLFIGGVQSGLGRTLEALRSFEQARAVLDELERSGAEDSLVRLQLDSAFGGLHREAGRSAEALHSYLQALELAKKQSAAAPDGPSQILLANGYISVGASQRDSGQLPESERSLKKAREILEQMISKKAKWLGLQTSMATTFLELGNTQKIIGNLRGATQSYDRALEVYSTVNDPATRGDHYQLARLHAQRANIIRLNRPRPTPAEEAESHKHLGAAIDELRQAIRSGYRNHPHLKRDPDLDPIRSHPDFQALVQDAAFPAYPFTSSE